VGQTPGTLSIGKRCVRISSTRRVVLSCQKRKRRSATRGKLELVISHDDLYYDIANRIVKFDYGRI
jgi:hypothetical protein